MELSLSICPVPHTGPSTCRKHLTLKVAPGVSYVRPTGRDTEEQGASAAAPQTPPAASGAAGIAGLHQILVSTSVFFCRWRHQLKGTSQRAGQQLPPGMKMGRAGPLGPWSEHTTLPPGADKGARRGPTLALALAELSPHPQTPVGGAQCRWRRLPGAEQGCEPPS